MVLINGVPASGKSTLAQRYVQEHPLTLALDIATVRGMLGCWLDRPIEAGQLARVLAVEMARAHLRTGRDVVVPQFLVRIEFVQTLAKLCDDISAEFVEVVLLSSPDEAVARFVRRTATSSAVHHRDAAALVERDGGTDVYIRRMCRQLREVVDARPASRVLRTIEGNPEAAYATLLQQLSPSAPN